MEGGTPVLSRRMPYVSVINWGERAPFDHRVGQRLKDARLHVSDELRKVAAVNRWIVEPGPRTVTMRNIASSADVAYGAIATGLAEGRCTGLVCTHERRPVYVIEVVGQNAHSEFRKLLATGFQDVNGLDPAVGLDYQDVVRTATNIVSR